MPSDRQPPGSKARGGLLAAVADFSLRYPKRSLIMAAVLLCACAAIALTLEINTSRFELVASDHPHQAKLLRFFDDFGYPDAMALVVTSGSEAERRRVVDELTDQLEAVPELNHRVLGRIRPEVVAEVLLLQRPDALSQIRTQLGDTGEVAALVEGGLPAWIAAVEAKISAGLEDADEGGDATAPPNAAQSAMAEQGLGALALMLEMLDGALSGSDPLRELPPLGDEELPPGVGVDKAGYLVGGDGSYNLVALFPGLPGPEVRQVKPLVDRIRAVRDGIELGPVDAKLTGLPALVTDELQVLYRGLTQTSIATVVGIILLLFLAFRSKRYTVLALMPLGVGILLTLAVTRIGWGQLNLITTSFIPVLLALGIAVAVFILNRYGEYVRAGKSARESIRGAVTGAGPGILIATITTVLAFLTLATTEFTAYAELGIITAVGLLLMLAATFLLLPALLWVAGRGREVSSPELPGVKKIPGFVRARAKLILVVATLLVAASAPFWGEVSFNARYFDFLPESTESAQALNRIERDSSVSPIHVGVKADSVEQARQLASKLRELPAVAAVQTPSDLLPPLNEEKLAALRAGFAGIDRQPDFEALRERKRTTQEVVERLRDLGDALDEVAYALRQAEMSTKSVDRAKRTCSALRTKVGNMKSTAAIAQVETGAANLLERAWTTARNVSKRGGYTPADLPPVFRARFASLDGTSLAVYANPAGNIWDSETSTTFRDQVATVAPEAAGMAVNICEHIRMIKEGFMRAGIMSGACVLLVLLAGFRRIVHAALALVPVVIGFCWTLGIMGLAGIAIDVANVTVLPLILGIGIDAGAHMIHRWRQSREDNGGVADLARIIRGTGAAVLLASLTTAVGFAALMTGEYGAMRSLGLVMTIGIGCCLLASLIVLPAVLLVLRKAK
jgi:predicted RND superfamily exporter protein